MARLRKTETSINITPTAAAPARRKAPNAPRQRTTAQPGVSSEPEAKEEVTGVAIPGEQVAEPVFATAESAVEAAGTGAPPSREAVAALAYSYWVERGYTEGCPEQDWLRAEAALSQRAFAAV